MDIQTRIRQIENEITTIENCMDNHDWKVNGHVARILVTDVVTSRVEVDELEHVTFSYRFESNQPSDNYRPLAPRIIHSIDGYVVREMVKRAKELGFQLAHIHDA